MHRVACADFTESLKSAVGLKRQTGRIYSSSAPPNLASPPQPCHAGNKVPGSEYDIALLVLDAQAPPYTGSDCGAQCIAMSTGRAADGTTLTSVGQGSARSASFEPSDLLQEVGCKLGPVHDITSTVQVMPRVLILGLPPPC